MAMDDESFVARWKRRPKPKEILGDAVHRAHRRLLHGRSPEASCRPRRRWTGPTRPMPRSRSPGVRTSPSWSAAAWRPACCRTFPTGTGSIRPGAPRRSWTPSTTISGAPVNAHLGTSAGSFPELVEQLGILRFGHRPRVADTFCGSGQIPFEAAELGCDVYASDLNPVACLLTWGALNIVGGSPESREQLAREQQALVQRVQERNRRLGGRDRRQRLAGQGLPLLRRDHLSPDRLVRPPAAQRGSSARATG